MTAEERLSAFRITARKYHLTAMVRQISKFVIIDREKCDIVMNKRVNGTQSRSPE